MIRKYVRLSAFILFILLGSAFLHPSYAFCNDPGQPPCSTYNSTCPPTPTTNPPVPGPPNCETFGGTCRQVFGGSWECYRESEYTGTPPPPTPSASPSPTQTPTPTPIRTPTLGAPCQIGNSDVCYDGHTCRCSADMNDYSSCGGNGHCWPTTGSYTCGPSASGGPTCVSNEDCYQLCGRGCEPDDVYCSGGRCVNEGPAQNCRLTTCAELGGTCSATCSDSPGVCRNSVASRDCFDQYCCISTSCPTPTDEPVRFELICNETGVNTVFGCITNPATDVFGHIVQIASAMAGGISFLLILFGSFQILISAGKPERLAAGQELVTSAVTGLLLILFSVFILSFLGVQLFQLPGFTQ